MKLLFLYHS